jgi:signal transduction histidine kinase
MSPELAALVVHDLKNELGALEALLAGQAERPGDGHKARQAHQQCTALRQRFVQFLTVYGSDDTLCAHATDESPIALLTSVVTHAAHTHPTLHMRLVAADAAPPFWFFDARLVRMALDAAMHNATRFARHEVRLQALSVDQWLVFRIDDDGPGLGTAAPLSDNATGLGTALCHGVAQAHRCGERRGRAALGDGPEGGARFELWLA